LESTAAADLLVTILLSTSDIVHASSMIGGIGSGSGSGSGRFGSGYIQHMQVGLQYSTINHESVAIIFCPLN